MTNANFALLQRSQQRTALNNRRVDALARKTEDAYSVSRYGAKSWHACAMLLVRAGLADDEVEWVLRSKHMRWAADAGNAEYGRATSGMLRRHLADPRSIPGDLQRYVRAQIALEVAS